MVRLERRTGMPYAMLYIDTADVVGMYDSRDAALLDLAAMLAQRPDLRDELGLLRYENGRPAGTFEPAGELLADQLPQQQLPIAPHGR
jgi:hypothetical protein